MVNVLSSNVLRHYFTNLSTSFDSILAISLSFIFQSAKIFLDALNWPFASFEATERASKKCYQCTIPTKKYQTLAFFETIWLKSLLKKPNQSAKLAWLDDAFCWPVVLTLLCSCSLLMLQSSTKISILEIALEFQYRRF